MAKRIVDMPRASFIEDGSVVEIEFKTRAGESLPLSFATNDFEHFVSLAVQLVNGARSQTLSTGDHLEFHTIRAVAAIAQAPVGGDRVILSIRTDTGLPYHFALTPDDAEALRPQLYRAAKSTRKQKALSRH